jgi:antitoxin (DNA-binding transcriptional repressor) of toxin-antitoxin stability system
VTVRAEVKNGQLADLVKQLEAGAEVLLTQGNKPVAKLVPISAEGEVAAKGLHIRSLPGHRLVSSTISQAGLAEEMFGRS